MSTCPPPRTDDCSGGHAERFSSLGWNAAMVSPMGSPGGAPRLAHHYVLARELALCVRVEIGLGTEWVTGAAGTRLIGPLKLRWMPPDDSITALPDRIKMVGPHSQDDFVRGSNNAAAKLAAAPSASKAFGSAIAGTPHGVIAALIGASDAATPSTTLLMDSVLMFSCQLVLDAKDLLGVPRPSDLAKFQPGTALPPHSAYPGGHALQLSLLRVLLGKGLGLQTRPNWTAVVDRIDELIDQREQLGLHSPLDTTDGVSLGEWLGDRLIEAASDGVGFRRWKEVFDKAKLEW